MAAADAAIITIRRRHRLDCDLEFYRLYTPEERNPETAPARLARFVDLDRSPVQYRCLRSGLASALSADAVVYWGDFLHSRDFLVQTAGVLAKAGAVATHGDGVRTVLRALYLTECGRDATRKAVIFGGTLLFNTAKDYADGEYAAALGGLLREAAGVWMREVYSVAAAQQRGCDHARLGADCATLLRPDDLDLFICRGDATAGAEGAVGVFFGRNVAEAGLAAEFAGGISDALGLRSEWLPWFDASLVGSRLAKSAASLPGLGQACLPDPPSAGDLLRRLSRYALVVTDTYHLCVTAWNLGIPAVCVGESFPAVPYDVSAGWYGSWRDKRNVFYSMHHANELYTTVEELVDPVRFARRLHVSLEALRDHWFVTAVVDGVRSKAVAAEQAFVEAIGTLGVEPYAPGGAAPC
jgi:hypothetical protein